MQRHLERAQVLMQQSRVDLAANELRQALVQDPHCAIAHAMLGICLCDSSQYNEALREVREAVHLEPDNDFCHYAHAAVLSSGNREREAREAIEAAIAINPYDADYFAKLAEIEHSQRRWKETLAAAEKGLAIDPEHVASNNLRALALVKLGRRAEAGAALESTMARQPEDAFTHANQGWLLIERNEYQKALSHFREALRLDPELEYARQGIVEALKARNPIYRFMLNYFLWMSKLSGKAQWAIILGAFFGMRILRVIARQSPGFAPLIVPIVIVYAVFALLTWLASPLFNLMLRLHPIGKWALSRDEITASNWLAACLGSAVFFLLLAFFVYDAFIILALVLGLLSLPMAATFVASRGWPRNVMIAYTAGAAFMGIAGAGLALVDSVVESGYFSLAFGMVMLSVFGSVLSGILGNLLGNIEPKKG